MPKYSYVAKDAQGKKVKGEVQAASESALYEVLRADQKYLISCKDLERTSRRTKKMKPQELSDFCRQLGTLLSAGVSLVRAMNLMQSEETLKPHIKAVYSDMLRMIRQGEAFSAAMEAQGKTFPELLVNMFKSAEETGSMDKTAMRMCDHYEKEYRLNAKIKNAMTYPKILTFMIVAVLAAIFGFIMPQFMEVFQDMELPAITKFLIWVSDSVVAYWPYIIVCVILLVLVIRSILKVPAVKLKIDEMKLKMPKLGPLFRTIYTARFARTLCTLYTSGIPIASALQVGKNTVGNKYLENQFDNAIAMVRRGESLSDALDSIDGFHKKMINSVQIGEETGSLDTMLISTADTFDYEADMAISRMVAILEPAMIIIMAAIVGFIMIAVMVPMYSMYSEIENSGSV